MSRSPNLICYYVLSQLLEQWFDPQKISNWKSPKADCMHWSQNQWQNYICSLCECCESFSSIFNVAKQKKGIEHKFLAATIWKHINELTNRGGKMVSYFDLEFPSLLKVIKDPPLLLNIIGDINILNAPMVSIVGSRKATARALFESEKLGYILAENGITIVSGGAYGCDIASHKGVLTTGLSPAPAVVVFGGGLGCYYPKGNLRWFRELNARQAVFISERLWGHKPRPFDFPVRNRIVSGLSFETIVMQCGKKSGAMITAKLALDQGREVSVLSFSEDDFAADGNLSLMDEGAHAFTFAEEWLDSFQSDMIIC